ncbi:ABC transporter ATP-binding protein [Mesorhizobium sp. ArgA1]
MLGLSVRDLRVSFRDLEKPALTVPALDIRPSEKVAVTGPSGSGKTTFINIVTGLERIRHGSVRWRDTELSSLSEARRDRWRSANVGLVMQEFYLCPGLSALENVLLPGRLSRVRPVADLKAEGLRLLERVEIERPGQPVETMSRGQMQRVAVARALVTRPAIIVADEPTASLDADSGIAVANLLLQLAGEAGTTLIVASHEKRLIERLDRIIRLEAGQVTRDTGASQEMAERDEAF